MKTEYVNTKPHDIKCGFCCVVNGKLYQFPTEEEADEYVKENKNDSQTVS